MSRPRAVLGLLLVVPAAAALVISYLAPTVWTVRTGRGHHPATEGYDFALSLAILPLFVFLVVAPILAYAAHRAGRPGRWLVRLGLAVPTVCFAPTALAAAWLMGRGERTGTAGEGPWMIRLATWSTLFGLVCGVGVTLYLAALRPREPGRSPWPAVATVGAVGSAAVVAAALQVYAYPALLSGGRIATPLVAEYRDAFQQSTVGPAAAQATTLLAVVGVLGLLATAVVILTGMRAEVEPVSRWLDERPGWRATGPAVTAGLGTLAVLAVTAYGLWPWLTRLGGASPPPGVSSASVTANTWLPPLVSTVVGVAVALLAGYGIGAVRPLGRWSELLLLPFAPWLFVGSGPLAVAGADRVLAAGQMNSFMGLIPPGWVAIPGLVIFTVLFRGQALARARDVAPMVALVGGATVLVRAQDLCWSYVVAADAEHLTGPLLAVRQLAEQPADRLSVGLVLPITLVVVFAVGLGVLQVYYLDRLCLKVGLRQWARDPERARRPVRLR